MQTKLIKITLFLGFISLNPLISEGEVTASSPAASASHLSLPTCENSPKNLNLVEKTQKENSTNSKRYDGYREVLKNSSDMELYARLAYAETLGANCPAQNEEIGSRIVNVIGNRVMKRNRNIKSVVFERAQFASSLHIYGSSRYKDFLCPQDEVLWKNIYKKVEEFMRVGSGPLSPDTVNYFLYKHDPRWPEEPWKLKEDTTGASAAGSKCLRVFKNSSWK